MVDNLFYQALNSIEETLYDPNHELGQRVVISYRKHQQILNFLSVAKDMMEPYRAMDYAVKQFVLPMIAGMGEGLYARYIDFGRYGDVSHDDEWGSLPMDTKGYILGVKYIPWKDVVWETFYSDQKYNHSGSIAGVAKDAKRHLFRTQFDFHF